MSRAPQTVDDLIAQLITIREAHGNLFVEVHPELSRAIAKLTGAEEYTVPVFTYDEADQEVFLDFDEEEEPELVKECEEFDYTKTPECIVGDAINGTCNH